MDIIKEFIANYGGELLLTAITAIFAFLGTALKKVVEDFVKDKEKQGGVYMTKRGQIKKIDEIAVQIVFSDGTKIALSDIVDVSNI